MLAELCNTGTHLCRALRGLNSPTRRASPSQNTYLCVYKDVMRCIRHSLLGRKFSQKLLLDAHDGLDVVNPQRLAPERRSVGGRRMHRSDPHEEIARAWAVRTRFLMVRPTQALSKGPTKGRKNEPLNSFLARVVKEQGTTPQPPTRRAQRVATPGFPAPFLPPPRPPSSASPQPHCQQQIGHLSF
jgi:hypothetical protein